MFKIIYKITEGYERYKEVEGERWTVDEFGALNVFDGDGKQVITFSADVWIFIYRIPYLKATE